MYLRISSLGALVLLGACSASEPAPAPEGEAIDCLLDGVLQRPARCTVENVAGSPDGEIVIHRPDGGFRRFLSDDSGTGLIAADGADEVTITRQSDRGADRVEISVGPDRYFLPPEFLGDEQSAE
ncbi:hypothetical protein [Altericroceibacterium endophyticum]|uniref:Uncharacterized protein n=1 Tax=Altericroceibacterium endophyticum TaxID=1808508 RepID=A0A6I4T7D3_9SPHN|nr:hypothetical protein [Altericroceibacterium endophyticum]MXO66041.1 hypothetical protein [Altericroceibacterium endophyticum]